MGPGFKYHVVTVSAIFFALTIGLVAGIFLSPKIATRQEKAIRDLQATVKNEVIEKNASLDQYRECLAKTTPVILHNRLKDIDIALIQTGDYPEAMNRAKEALIMAGAKIASQTVIEPSWNQSDELLVARLAAAHSTNPKFPMNRTELANRVGELLAKGDDPIDPFLPVLEQEKFLRLNREDDRTASVKYAVITIGSRNPAGGRISLADLPLILALQKQGVKVIACELLEAESSDIPSYRDLKLGVSTVDNVNRDIGQLALIFAITGEIDDYGVKQTAKRLLPSISP